VTGLVDPDEDRCCRLSMGPTKQRMYQRMSNRLATPVNQSRQANCLL